MSIGSNAVPFALVLPFGFGLGLFFFCVAFADVALLLAEPLFTY
jgi:hypothetical protein